MQSLPLRFREEFGRRNGKVLFRGRRISASEFTGLRPVRHFVFVNTHSYYIPPPFFADTHCFAFFARLFFSFNTCIPHLLPSSKQILLTGFSLTHELHFLIFNLFLFALKEFPFFQPFSSFATVSTSFYSFFYPVNHFQLRFLFNDIRRKIFLRLHYRLSLSLSLSLVKCF